MELLLELSPEELDELSLDSPRDLWDRFLLLLVPLGRPPDFDLSLLLLFFFFLFFCFRSVFLDLVGRSPL